MTLSPVLSKYVDTSFGSTSIRPKKEVVSASHSLQLCPDEPGAAGALFSMFRATVQSNFHSETGMALRPGFVHGYCFRHGNVR